MDFSLRPLAGLQTPGFFRALVDPLGVDRYTDLRARAFFTLRCLADFQAPGFFSPLALAEFFLAAFDHSPLDFAAVAIAWLGSAVIAWRVGFIADAFRPGHALLGPRHRKVRLPSFRGDHLGYVRVAARGQFVGNSVSQGPPAGRLTSQRRTGQQHRRDSRHPDHTLVSHCRSPYISFSRVIRSNHMPCRPNGLAGANGAKAHAPAAGRNRAQPNHTLCS